MPLDRWFRDDLAIYTQSMLGPGARVRGHLTVGRSTRCWPSNGRDGAHGHALWTLLTLELFLRRHDW